MGKLTYQDLQARERGVKLLHAQVDIGAVGVSTVRKKHGIIDVTRTAAGTYEVTLQEKFLSLIGVVFTFMNAAGEDITCQLVSEDVAGTGKFVFMTKAAALATDPSNGSVIYIKADMKDTSVEF